MDLIWRSICVALKQCILIHPQESTFSVGNSFSTNPCHFLPKIALTTSPQLVHNTMHNHHYITIFISVFTNLIALSKGVELVSPVAFFCTKSTPLLYYNFGVVQRLTTIKVHLAQQQQPNDRRLDCVDVNESEKSEHFAEIDGCFFLQGLSCSLFYWQHYSISPLAALVIPSWRALNIQ